jgi:hypothetical protein
LRYKRALLLFAFILFLAFPAANVDWIRYMENSGSAAGDLTTNLTDGEINQSNDGKYRDGVIDNFDYFLNPGYPAGFTHNGENTGSG